MKMAPLVLVTPSTQNAGAEFSDRSLSLSQRYCQALSVAGGIPWVMPLDPVPRRVAECVHRSHGVVLTGGNDVQTSLYDPQMPAGRRRRVHPPDPARDAVELMLIRECLRQAKPLLAICRGLQILNVALGGDLLADIPTQAPQAQNHLCPDRKDQLVHTLDVVPGSLLARCLGRTRLRVNSTHHQAVARVAAPLRATATCPDGIIEALELAPAESAWSPFVLAVQFHPERLWERHSDFLAIFKSFIRACASGHN